jgi:hypothetical protein
MEEERGAMGEEKGYRETAKFVLNKERVNPFCGSADTLFFFVFPFTTAPPTHTHRPVLYTQ